MTEEEWLAERDPLALARLARERVMDYRFRDMACRWINRCQKNLFEDVRTRWVAYLSYLKGECEHPRSQSSEETAYETQLRYNSDIPDSQIPYDEIFWSSENAVNLLVWSDEAVMAVGFAGRSHMIYINTLIAARKNLPIEEVYSEINFTALRFALEFHDIAGNPFRPVAFQESWRSETVCALAKSMVAQSAFDRMPILADALEEAGCDSMDVLNHCRLETFHVAECWILDAIKGLV